MIKWIISYYNTKQGKIHDKAIYCRRNKFNVEAIKKYCKKIEIKDLIIREIVAIEGRNVSWYDFNITDEPIKHYFESSAFGNYCIIGNKEYYDIIRRSKGLKNTKYKIGDIVKINSNARYAFGKDMQFGIINYIPNISYSLYLVYDIILIGKYIDGSIFSYDSMYADYGLSEIEFEKISINDIPRNYREKLIEIYREYNKSYPEKFPLSNIE